MSTYAGPAILVAEDVEHDVQVDLWVEQDGPLKRWVGNLQADGDHATWEAFNQNASIRLPSGREATVILKNAGSHVRIVGSGVPPF